MAIVSGKARVALNGIDLGEMSFREVQPQPKTVAIEQPKAIDLTVEIRWTPEAMPIINEMILQAELGKHYGN